MGVLKKSHKFPVNNPPVTRPYKVRGVNEKMGGGISTCVTWSVLGPAQLRKVRAMF